MISSTADEQAAEASRIQSSVCEAVSKWSQNLPYTLVSQLREVVRTFVVSMNTNQQTFLEVSGGIRTWLQQGTSSYKVLLNAL